MPHAFNHFTSARSFKPSIFITSSSPIHHHFPSPTSLLLSSSQTLPLPSSISPNRTPHKPLPVPPSHRLSSQDTPSARLFFAHSIMLPHYDQDLIRGISGTVESCCPSGQQSGVPSSSVRGCQQQRQTPRRGNRRNKEMPKSNDLLLYCMRPFQPNVTVWLEARLWGEISVISEVGIGEGGLIA